MTVGGVIQSGAKMRGGNTPFGNGPGVVTGGISTTIGSPPTTTMATTRGPRIRRTATPDTATISSPKKLPAIKHAGDRTGSAAPMSSPATDQSLHRHDTPLGFRGHS